MGVTSAERFYWALCVPGALLPIAAVAPWLSEHGPNLPLFFANIFDSPVDAMFGWDVIVTVAALVAFVAIDGTRLGVRHRWAPILGGCVVGASLGLPLYLALRERAQRRAERC